jgi:hypothetical protein
VLGTFILFLQEPNGRFHSTYDPAVGDFGSFQSLFYPGEAILALASVHRIDPDPRWLAAAMKGIAYLEESRRTLPLGRLPSRLLFRSLGRQGRAFQTMRDGALLIMQGIWVLE